MFGSRMDDLRLSIKEYLEADNAYKDSKEIDQPKKNVEGKGSSRVLVA